MLTNPCSEVSRLLAEWGQGDLEVEAELIPLVYNELRRIARAHLWRERSDHTLQPTALVHEAYLRLLGQKQMSWRGRAHFLAVASNMMRRILVDHARSLRYAKRGGGRSRVQLSEVDEPSFEQPEQVIEIDELLKRLAVMDSTKASIVELRFFGGLTEREVAEVLGCSQRTVTRHWRMAKAWLLHEMG